MQSLYGAIANTNKKEIMVSVDAVYQKVLAIANKEQRGYITPQEFNLFADHAQKDIFRQYFYDLEQFQRRTDGTAELIQDKIAEFKVYSPMGESLNLIDIPNFYKVFQITLHNPDTHLDVVAEKIQYEDFYAMNISPLTRANASRPVFYIRERKINVFPEGLTNWHLRYIREPISPNWTYVIVGESAMFNDDRPGFMDFELHESEETLLVIKILQLAGINIKDPALVQLASQEEVKKIQQEKQ